MWPRVSRKRQSYRRIATSWAIGFVIENHPGKEEPRDKSPHVLGPKWPWWFRLRIAFDSCATCWGFGFPSRSYLAGPIRNLDRAVRRGFGFCSKSYLVGLVASLRWLAEGSESELHARSYADLVGSVSLSMLMTPRFRELPGI